MAEIRYRPYTPDDYNVITKLFSNFGNYFVEIDPLKRTRLIEDHGKKYTDETLLIINENNGLFLLALNGDQIIGFVVAITQEQSYLETLETIPTKYGRVTELFVTEEYRGKKIGHTLLEYAETHFKRNECDAVIIDVFASNNSALNFYKSHGYQPRMITTIKIITDSI